MTNENLPTPETLNPPPLPKPRPWGFWSTFGWTVLLVLCHGLTQIPVAVIFDLDFNVLTGTLAGLTGCAANVLVVLMVVAIISFRKGWTVRDYLALTPVKLRSIAFWCVVIVSWSVLYDLIMVVLERPVVPEVNKQLFATASPKWVLFLAIVVAAPIGEEVLFRGFTYRGWSESRLGKIGAVLLLSIGFAALHSQYDMYGMVGAGMLGLIMGLARIQSNSLYTCIAMHMIVNLVAYIQTAVVTSREVIFI